MQKLSHFVEIPHTLCYNIFRVAVKEGSHMEKNTEYEKMLMNEREKLNGEMERSKARKFPVNIIFFTLVGTAFSICGIVLSLNSAGLTKQSAVSGIFPALLMILGVAVILFGVLYNIFASISSDTRHTSLTSRRAQIDETIAVMSAENKTTKVQAEVRFDNSQSDFKRFFDVNLNQLSWVFKLGIGTILAGMIIIILAIIMFAISPVKYNIAVLTGAVSGILVDFIGALFIRMYTETIKATMQLQNNLVHNNDNLLANLLAENIDDKNLRNQTIAEIAKTISANNAAPPETSTEAEE